MSFSNFNPSDTILLLGEGNFSFSANLIQTLTNQEDSFGSSDISLTATCFESNSEDFSEEKLKNIDFLRNRGVTVLYGVDVNNLEQHFTKGINVFSKIIFNFPHVGGKMKIHLNRTLLKNIFINVSHFITNDSELYITLCDGQGGTGADTKIRRYDDTWQVVEMAAISNFILKYVEPFPLELFPNYCSVGFRGWEKGFHVENSIIHIFQLGIPMDISSLKKDLITFFSDGQIETNFGTITCQKIYSDLHCLNLFAQRNSPFNFFIGKLEEVLKKCNLDKKTCFLPDNVCPLHVPYTEGTISFVGQEKVKLRSSLLEVIEVGLDPKDALDETFFVFKGHIFNDLTDSFEKSPIEGQIILLGSSGLEYTVEFLNSVKGQLKSELKFDTVEESNDSGEIFARNESSSEKVLIVKWSKIFCREKCISVCTILCDSLIKSLLKINHWQEIWSENLSLEPNSFRVINQPSLYPLTFKFDVNFLVTPSFDVLEYYRLLWNLAHIAVINTELISEYIPPDNALKRFLCYRIYYKSFRHPFCRSVALDFHQNIVCGAIVSVLNALVM